MKYIFKTLISGKPSNDESNESFAPTVFDCYKKSPTRRVSKVSTTKRVSPLHKRCIYKRNLKRYYFAKMILHVFRCAFLKIFL